MKPFEIPYNFDIKLIDFLNIYNIIDIHCIYVAPFREHYKSAKFYEGLIPTSSPNNLSEYEKHIEYINKYFPNKLMLLLQQNNILMDKNLINYYLSLGFTKFCVGSIAQANLIKEIGNYEIIGSITTKIDNDKLLQNDYSNFDGFVLWFPYNRDITKISLLPKNFKYILLVNCGCNIHCDGTHHWLTKKPVIYKDICPNKKIGQYFESIIFIPEYDLQYFDPYISYYKLQGREYSTCNIIRDIVKWSETREVMNLEHSNLIRNYNPFIIYNIKEEKIYGN